MDRGVNRRAFLRRAAFAGAGAVLTANTVGSRVLSAGFGPLDSDGAISRRVGSTVAGAPDIVTRVAWGADESRRRQTPTFHPPRTIFVHHTAMPVTDDSAADVREVYRQHLMRDGGTWSDIGYHFLIDRRGTVFEGRWAREYEKGELHDSHDVFDRVVRGAHAQHVNTGTLGIALLGNFEDGAEPTSAMIDGLVDLMAWLCTRHRLDPEGSGALSDATGTVRTLPTIVGHRDAKSTACPGTAVYRMLPQIRQRVAEQVETMARPRSTGAYRVVHRDGSISTRGSLDAVAGDATAVPAAIIGAAAAGNQGVLLADEIGGVHAFGDAPYHGSIPQLRANGQPIGTAEVAAIAPTPTGNGYWLLDRTGGVFTFGDAPYHGSIPQLRANGQPVGTADAAAIAPTPTGNGYWLLDRTGGVFTFGDAPYHGSGPSTGSRGAPAASIVPTRGRDGYYILCEDGAVLAFGDAEFAGHGASVLASDLVIAN